MLLVTLAFPAAGARGELVEVRQVAGGMECAECARSLKLDVGRLDGVEAAAASWNRRILTVRFRSGSHATLEQLRAIVRRHHFSAREAEVVARGRLSPAPDGTLLLLTVTGSGVVYEIAAGTAPRGIAAAVGPDPTARLARAAARGEELTVRGRVAGDEILGSPAATGAHSGIVRFWILEILETQEISAR